MDFEWGLVRMSTEIDSQTDCAGNASLLIVIPGTVNYFYDLYGRWVAAAYREMGLRVEVHVLPEVPEADYDLCIFSNVCEIEFANRDLNARDRLRAIRRQSKILISLIADCVHTPWFGANLALAAEFGADGILDVGFMAQDAPGFAAHRLRYHFAFDGLLKSQARTPNASSQEDAASRTIPWAHIGASSPKRVELTDRIITGFAPHGLVYLPGLSPVKEQGSPHLNPRHMERILARVRYYLWCSQHESFFMESLRFKMAWLSGCVPIKVVDNAARIPDDLAFSTWVIQEHELVERLRALDFNEARDRFRDEYLRRPRFDDGLAAMLRDYGYHPLEVTAQDARTALQGEPLRLCA
jgi:hypothetical protein